MRMIGVRITASPRLWLRSVSLCASTSCGRMCAADSELAKLAPALLRARRLRMSASGKAATKAPPAAHVRFAAGSGHLDDRPLCADTVESRNLHRLRFLARI